MYKGFRYHTEYLPFYFQGHRILSILLPGILNTVFNMPVYKGYLPINLNGYGIFGTPYTSHNYCMMRMKLAWAART